MQSIKNILNDKELYTDDINVYSIDRVDQYVYIDRVILTNKGISLIDCDNVLIDELVPCSTDEAINMLINKLTENSYISLGMVELLNYNRLLTMYYDKDNLYITINNIYYYLNIEKCVFEKSKNVEGCQVGSTVFNNKVSTLLTNNIIPYLTDYHDDETQGMKQLLPISNIKITDSNYHLLNNNAMIVHTCKPLNDVRYYPDKGLTF